MYDIQNAQFKKRCVFNNSNNLRKKNSWPQEITLLWFATRAASQQSQLHHAITSPLMKSTIETAADKLMYKINSSALTCLI